MSLWIVAVRELFAVKVVNLTHGSNPPTPRGTRAHYCVHVSQNLVGPPLARTTAWSRSVMLSTKC